MVAQHLTKTLLGLGSKLIFFRNSNQFGWTMFKMQIMKIDFRLTRVNTVADGSVSALGSYFS